MLSRIHILPFIFTLAAPATSQAKGHYFPLGTHAHTGGHYTILGNNLNSTAAAARGNSLPPSLLVLRNPMVPFFPVFYGGAPMAFPAPTGQGDGGYSKPPAAAGNNPATATESTSITPKATPHSQTALQVEAIRLNDAGSRLNASIGIVTCAEAMNTLADDRGAGGVLLESCVNSFKASTKMKEAEQQARAHVNAEGNPEIGFSEDVVNSPKGTEIFADLEEKYGVSKIEFTEIVLASRGRPSVLASETFLNQVSGGKMSQDTVLMGFAEASKMSQEEKDKVLAESRTAGLADQFALDLSKGPSYLAMNRSTLAPQSVRRFLQENKDKVEAIEGKTKADSAMGIREPASKPVFREHLTPIESDPFLSEVAKIRESMGALASMREDGSLFQMVHSKYKEKSHLLGR